MKCFHFPNNANIDANDIAPTTSKLGPTPWARSLSAASSSAGLDARRSGSDPDPDPDPMRLRPFEFSELKAATKGFSRSLMVGEGGFGCVYKEVIALEGGESLDVAVKQLNRNGSQGHKEWITEVNFLGVVKHPNLVKLVGYCAEDDERGIQRLLVYELMPKKSLEDHLLGRVSSNLSWPLRLKIAQDAARGLAYLHEEMNFQLIFRDFKSSNILLDEDFNAKLSDFGLARYGLAEGVSHVSTSIVGTVGYTAPEYIQTRKLTSKSDVWSFGVVLFELLTGRRPIDKNLPKSEQRLLDWVKPYTSDPKKIHIIIDPRPEGQYSTKSAQKLIALANRCLMKNPKSRPKMSEAVEMLSENIEVSTIEENVDELEDPNESSSYSRVFDITEIISLRNRTVGRLDWRAITPGPVGKLPRTWR